MGRPQPGGITPNRAPMGMPTFKGAGGGIVAFNEGNLVEDEEKDKNQTPPIPSQNQTQALQQVITKNPKGQPPAPEEEEENEAMKAIFGGVDKNLPYDQYLRQVMLNRMQYSLKKEAEERKKLEEAYEPETGFFSDAFINRLIAMGGQPSVAQGLIEGQRQAAGLKREDRDKLTAALSKVRGQDASIANALASSLLGAGQLSLETEKFKESKDQFEQEFGLKESKLGLEEMQQVINLQQKERLMDIQQYSADIQAARADAEKTYREIMAEAALLDSATKAKDIVVRLANHKNDYLQLLEAITDNQVIGEQTKEERLKDAIRDFNKNNRELMEKYSKPAEKALEGLRNRQGNQGTGILTPNDIYNRQLESRDRGIASFI